MKVLIMLYIHWTIYLLIDWLITDISGLPQDDGVYNAILRTIDWLIDWLITDISGLPQDDGFHNAIH